MKLNSLTAMRYREVSMKCVMFSATLLVVVAMPEQDIFLSAADGNGNKTITIGYFLDVELRIAVIGMAIEQARTDGLLSGYDFK